MMALGDPYAELLELVERLDVPDSSDNTALDSALTAASRGIEKLTGRQFNDAETASARTYRPDSWLKLQVDDFHTTTGLEIATDDGDTGSFDTVWSATDYELYPLNGVVEGESGWPWNKIHAVESRLFPCGRRATVRVTARWGWAEVPAAVHEACLVAAVEMFKLKDTPFGVGGYTDFGIMRVRDNPFVARMLAPYTRTVFLVA